MSHLPTKTILGSPITAMPFKQQIAVIMAWAKERQPRFVCVANVHMLVEARLKKEFSEVLKQADLVTPDGMPLVWMLKCLGSLRQNRVAGMELFLELCKNAEQSEISIFLLGSQKDILERMTNRLKENYPNLQIADTAPLPFRPLLPNERADILESIRKSGAGLVFVSLGCPKQENWMSQNSAQVPAVMLGLGGVFPVYAGIHRWAPRWIRESGLEWFFRLIQDPKRLWKRYLTTNFVFVVLATLQLIGLFFQPLFTKRRGLEVQPFPEHNP